MIVLFDSWKRRTILWVVLFLVAILPALGMSFYNHVVVLTGYLQAPAGMQSRAIFQCQNGKCGRGFYVERHSAEVGGSLKSIRIDNLSEDSLGQLATLLNGADFLGVKSGSFSLNESNSCGHVVRDRPHSALGLEVMPLGADCPNGGCDSSSNAPGGVSGGPCVVSLTLLSGDVGLTSYLREKTLWTLAAIYLSIWAGPS